ncbi:hypothetical protein FACS189494_11080 [Spirochaetia bacterium]|nr:hypothetical protein FACS189494_11080 [Spirochaetia bacterium]
MKRKAFLIGSPMEVGTKNFLPGVTPDIINMKRILHSNTGGAWDYNEIKVFENPTREELYEKMSREYDFVIVQYSGHGFEYSRSGTTLDINPYESITLKEIHGITKCPKRYYFLDSCRGIVPEELNKNLKFFSMMESAREDIRKAYRNKYENVIEQCENGNSIIYSCGLNESADEDPDGLGGIFSLSYFRTADAIDNIPMNEYYSIQDVFNLAVEKMKEDYYLSDQNPMMKPERRNHYFPFLI